MGIREKLNENPAVTTGATAAIVVIALAFIIYQLIPSRPSIPTQNFYSTDDGASYFKDDIKKVPPYTYEGKEAVRARVYKCPGGSAFVGFLEKYTPEAKKQLDMQNQPGAPVTPNFNAAAEMALQTGYMVKKPGDKVWVNQRDPNFQKVVDVRCPDGKSDIELVTP